MKPERVGDLFSAGGGAVKMPVQGEQANTNIRNLFNPAPETVTPVMDEEIHDGAVHAFTDMFVTYIGNYKQLLTYAAGSNPGMGMPSQLLLQDMGLASAGDPEAQKRIKAAKTGAAQFAIDMAAGKVYQVTAKGLGLLSAATGIGAPEFAVAGARRVGSRLAGLAYGTLPRIAAWMGTEATLGAGYGAVVPLEKGESRGNAIATMAATQALMGPAFGGAIKLTGKVLRPILESVLPQELSVRLMGLTLAQENAIYARARMMAKEAAQDIPLASRAQGESAAFIASIHGIIEQGLIEPNAVMFDDVLNEPVRSQRGTPPSTPKERASASKALDASLERAPRDVGLADLPSAESALELTPEFNVKQWRIREAQQAVLDAVSPEERIKAAAVYEQEVARSVAERNRRISTVGTPEGMRSTSDEAVAIRPLEESGARVNPDGSIELSVVRGAGDIPTTSPESVVGSVRGALKGQYEQVRTRFKNPLIVDDWTSPEVLVHTSQAAPEPLKPVWVRTLGTSTVSENNFIMPKGTKVSEVDLHYDVGGGHEVRIRLTHAPGQPLYIEGMGTWKHPSTPGMPSNTIRVGRGLPTEESVHQVGREALQAIKRDLAERFPHSNGMIAGERITGSRHGLYGKFDLDYGVVAFDERDAVTALNIARVPLNPRGAAGGSEMSRWIRLQTEKLKASARAAGHDGIVIRRGRMGEPEIIPLVDGTTVPVRSLRVDEVPILASTEGGFRGVMERAAKVARRGTPDGQLKFAEMELDRLRSQIPDGKVGEVFDELNKVYEFTNALVKEQESFSNVLEHKNLSFEQEKVRTLTEIATQQANEVVLPTAKPAGYQSTDIGLDAQRPLGDGQKVIDAARIRDLAVREWVKNTPWQEMAAPEVVAHKTSLEVRLAEFEKMPLFERRNPEVAAILDAMLDGDMYKANPTVELGLSVFPERELVLDAIGDVARPRGENLVKVRKAITAIDGTYHPIDTRIADAFATGVPSPIAPHFGYKVDGSHLQGRSVAQTLAEMTIEQTDAMLAVARSVVARDRNGFIHSTTMGAMAGAVAGGTLGAKENEEHPIRGMFEGALAGALVGRGAVRMAQYGAAGQSHAARALAARLGLGVAGLTLEELSMRTDDPKYRAITRGVGGFLLWAALADQGWVRSISQKSSVFRTLAKSMYGPAGLMEHQEEVFISGSNLFNTGAVMGKWTQLKLKKGLSENVLKNIGVEFMEEVDVSKHPLWRTLTPQEKTLIMTERQGMQVLGQTLEGLGLIDAYRDGYVRHMLPPETFVRWQQMSPYAGNRPGFTKSRVFPKISDLEAWTAQQGLKGPVRDLGVLQAAHYREVYKLISTNALLQTFKDMGAVRELGDMTILPKGYRAIKISGHKPLVAEEGLAQSIEQFADRVGYTGTVAKAADVLRSTMMRWINLVSLDHMFNTGRGMLSSGVYNPKWITHASQMINEGTILNEGARYGLVVHSRPDIVHAISDEMEQALMKFGASAKTAKVINTIAQKNPLSVGMNAIADWQERLLFDHMVPTLNTAIFLKEQHNWMKRTKFQYKPGDAVYEASMRRIATYANNVVGYMPEMLRGGKSAYFQRQVFFAPTWMQTRIQLTAHAGGDLGAVMRGEMKIGDAMYLKHQMRKYLLIGGITYVLSKALSGEDPEFSDRTYKLYARTGIRDANGRELGIDMAGWWLDDMKLFNNPWLFARHKASPLVSFADHMFSGRDAFGNTIVGGERLDDFSRSLGSAPAVINTLAKVAQSDDMSSADKLRAAGDISMLGNISTIPNGYDKVGRVVAEKLLRERGFPLNEDNLHAIASLVVLNMKNGKSILGNNVMTEMERIHGKYKKKSVPYWGSQIAAPWIAEHLGLE